jgi:nicotinamidase-related amidase
MPNFKSSALITIDTQRDTLDGQPLEIKGTTQALPYIKELLDFFRAHQLPIVHIVRIYKKDGTNVDLCRKESVENGAELLMENTVGTELAKELFDKDDIHFNTKLLLDGGIQYLSNYEVIIYKPRWGAFYQTPLNEFLHKYEVDTLVFSGCNYPNCPRTSIYEAGERDYKVVLAEDAVSGLYEQGKKELQNIDVWVKPTAEILKEATHALSET